MNTMQTGTGSATQSARQIEPAKLRRVCERSALTFASTAELEPLGSLLGQERALGAIQFGSRIDQPGYNMFVLGPQGTGRHTAILSYLKDKAALEPAPDDWVYVHNFSSSHHPKALRLPPGAASPFRNAMEELVEDLKAGIPDLFQSDEYHEKRRAIDAEFEETQEKAFEELRNKAAAQNVEILRTPMGFALAPVQNGEVIKPDKFNALPEKQRKEIEASITDLQKDLTGILERLPMLEKKRRDQIRTLNGQLTGTVVDASIKVVAEKFQQIEVIQERLKEVREDVVEHAEWFLGQESNQAGMMFPHSGGGIPNVDNRFNRYLVNVMVANDTDGDQKGAPIISENHPTLSNMVGRVEHLSQFGALITDFTMIRSGALHRANGGYLVLDARRILTQPFSWEALKRALQSETVRIVSAAEQLSLTSTITLEPEPIPLDVKVVLIGERILYYLLSTLDPDFAELFKVQVDFSEETEWSNENVDLLARLIAAISQKEKLLPLSADGVARVVEETARFAEDAERISLKIGQLADLLREADFWAGEAEREMITDADIDKAISEQIHRADRLKEHSHEMIDRGTILIDTEGATVGQINGLSVLSLGNFRFGRPTRITVRCRAGSGKIVDIERETKLGGPLHSKGVLIMTGYLAATYSLDAPMSLWASIVFEQSYGGVDGDSASCAELYAMLSALADVPIRQSLAVTGSVNQYGQVQAIGGVNEKIEGFFDICKTRGLTGKQGVLIPAANEKHLMLRKDVVDAVANGDFAVYAVETISQGIELLTGLTAGERGRDGAFPEGSINALVEQKLKLFAETRKLFAQDEEKEEKAEESS